MKKIPLRKCVATNEVLPKKELLRIVRTPQQEVKIDLLGKMNGRGCYIKKDPATVEIIKKRKTLEKNLEVKVDDSFYDELLKVINGE
ncbi:MAG: YlxR family protein [Erysipelotrichaceae bacterium]|nr:YlxR family protein [Erysipelotrichaceae bacterium]MDY5251337.1 YlxR family protein [Erysipelotrichaceae bacterium]